MKLHKFQEKVNPQFPENETLGLVEDCLEHPLFFKVPTFILYLWKYLCST
jgi:hypothetical protein